MWRCSECGFESPSYFGLCPKCKNGMGERLADFSDNSNSQTISYTGRVVQNFDQSKLQHLDPNAEQQKAIFVTKYHGLNAILGNAGGLVAGQVVLLGAAPGVGKSTLCMSIANERTLYVSSEENYDQINQRGLRVNADSKCAILPAKSMDTVLSAIYQVDDVDLVIIDSLQGIEFGVGYQTVAKYAAEITDAAKATGKAVIMISQVARTGEVAGLNAINHIVDTVLYLERSETSRDIIAVGTKNRYGEIGSIAVFQHESNGFVEIEVGNAHPKPEVGVVHAETNFGHRRVNVAFESLVTKAQAPYGLRKAMGWNSNRLMQLVGVLSWFGKLKLIDKDIYISVSNGLHVDDVGVELAVACSILSSLYRTAPVVKAYGEVRLNGNVHDGVVRLANGEAVNVNSLKEIFDIYGIKEGKNVGTDQSI